MVKKVVFAIRRDYAGMFHRLYDAINRYTDYKATHITYEPSRKYGAPHQYCFELMKSHNRLDLLRRISNCDLAVVSDDFFRLPYSDRLPDKKIVYTGGSFYRRKHAQLSNRYNKLGVRKVVISTPDLVLNGNETYVPAPFDAEVILPCERTIEDLKKELIIGHICSTKHGEVGFKRKGFYTIRSAIRELGETYENVKWKFLTGRTNEQILEEIRNFAIFVEAIDGDTGVIGYSGIEASAHAIPVVCQKDNDFGNPIIYANSETLYEVLEELVSHPQSIIDIGNRQREWCIKTHGYKSVVGKLKKIFGELNE